MATKEEREIIRARLDEIAEQNDGRITPELVVTDAQDPESPLHGLFDWDVSKAAMAHWLDKARQIIRSVEVVIRTERTVVQTPYYVRDPSASKHEQGYVKVTSIKSESDEAREVLVEEFGRVASMLRRARSIAQVLDMQDEIDALLDGVVGLQARVMQQPQAGLQ